MEGAGRHFLDAETLGGPAAEGRRRFETHVANDATNLADLVVLRDHAASATLGPRGEAAAALEAQKL